MLFLLPSLSTLRQNEYAYSATRVIWAFRARMPLPQTLFFRQNKILFPGGGGGGAYWGDVEKRGEPENRYYEPRSLVTAVQILSLHSQLFHVYRVRGVWLKRFSCESVSVAMEIPCTRTEVSHELQAFALILPLCLSFQHETCALRLSYSYFIVELLQSYWNPKGSKQKPTSNEPLPERRTWCIFQVFPWFPDFWNNTLLQSFTLRVPISVPYMW